MLLNLTVENYALIERLEITLAPSLNIITGETGAGKSILLGALGLLLGAKNDGVATMHNTKSCVIEGEFSICGLGLEPLFERNDWEYEPVITIRRVITAAGKSRAFISDMPLSLGELRELGARLIDIHSQHHNQIVSDASFRLSAIDHEWDSASMLERYRSLYGELQRLRAQLKEVEEQIALARRDEEWITYQVEELNRASLRSGELSEAESELRILENAESIGGVLSRFVERMDGEQSSQDGGVLLSLYNSQREMQQITTNYPLAEEYAQRLESLLVELKDLTTTLRDNIESVEFDPERLAKMSGRVDQLYSLCQKHRVADLEELIELRDRYAQQLSLITLSDEQIIELRRAVEECEQRLYTLAQEISQRRAEVTPRFEQSVLSILHRLGLERASFRVNISPLASFGESGVDRVDFLFSSVEGRAPQPIERIASGGEISRVMLALKGVVARGMNLPTIIFDEIDTGVSGRIADAMGDIIAEMATNMQVVDITHLPQVASKGDSHFVVYKEGGHTSIRPLEAEARVEHIATMLSGSEVTQSALAQARILLGEKKGRL